MNNSNNDNQLALRSTNILIPHGFFSKKGGKSVGLYESLNCSYYVGDSSENVKANLDIIKNSLCSDNVESKIITPKQIHSNICIEVRKDSENGIECDAMVTKEKNIVIGVYTADCAPILFFDPVGEVIGVAHAGWRGAVGGVIESTVAKMLELGSNAQNIFVAIGPCIGKDSYEIDDDFKKNFSGSGDCFCIVNYRLHFDLSKFCLKKLIAAGIKDTNVEIIDVDTYANVSDYFSYRFANQNSNGVCGRQISAICLV
ncbi:MAG: peptidoglycan editing factor PgeF [Alphaproteobacteria bacterium]|nr:peptidoglycan editing factor PgeF [Alphaproteobacteria bacterium]